MKKNSNSGRTEKKLTPPKQLDFLSQETRKFKDPYGGSLLNTRKGRSYGRPLDTKRTIHLVLRSSKAKGEWSFSKAQNSAKVKGIVHKFSLKYGIRILSFANVGNHLHLQIKLKNRFTYRPFIRAITAAIAMAVTGVSRWSVVEKEASTSQRNADKNEIEQKSKNTKEKFWDHRPFTRIVIGLRDYLNLKDYISLNQLEGFGLTRGQARLILASNNLGPPN